MDILSIKIVAAPPPAGQVASRDKLDPELLSALATALAARAAVAAVQPADVAARAAIAADTQRRLATTPEGAALAAATHTLGAAEDAERAADGYLDHVLDCIELDHAPDSDSWAESARSTLQAATAACDSARDAWCAAQEAFSACADPEVIAGFAASDAALCAAVKEFRRADAALHEMAGRLGLVVSVEGLPL